MSRQLAEKKSRLDDQQRRPILAFDDLSSSYCKFQLLFYLFGTVSFGFQPDVIGFCFVVLILVA